jgi:hypothetical protein
MNVGRLGLGSVYRKACTFIEQQNTENGGHKSVPQAGFETAISLFELPKTIQRPCKNCNNVIICLVLINNINNELLYLT